MAHTHHHPLRQDEREPAWIRSALRAAGYTRARLSRRDIDETVEDVLLDVAGGRVSYQLEG